MAILTRTALLMALCFCVPVTAFAKRVAFIAGVNEYTHLDPLQKAVGDARAVKAMLAEIGGVTVAAHLENPARDEFWRAWDAFLAQVSEGDEAFVFISSHGFEIDGVNYLLTKDAPAPARGQRIIQQEGVKFGELLANLSGKNPRFSLFVLDACRNNPYAAKGTRNIGGERGLARIEPPAGAFVMYSAGINETALDRLSAADPEPTSVYMRRLLPLLKTPGLKIQDVAQQVREDVYELAAAVPHKQSPTYYDNVIGRGKFCFAGCQGGGPKQPYEIALAKPQPVAPKPQPQIALPKPTSAIEMAKPEQSAPKPQIVVPKPSSTIAIAKPEPSVPKLQPQIADEHVTQRLVRSFLGHASGVTSVAFSPDGRFALSGSWDKTLKMWDVATGGEIRTFTGHASYVTSVGFSPDGRFALSGSCGKTRTKKDGEFLNPCIEGSIKLWETVTGREIKSFTGHTDKVNSVAFSPDGRLALSGSEDNTLKLWDVASGREIRSFTGHNKRKGILSVAFSPDGRFVLSGGWDGTLKLWDVATGREIRSFTGHTDEVNSVAFSPDGRLAVSGSYDTKLKLWEVATGREIRSFTTHKSAVRSVAFSPDGRFVLSGAGYAQTPNPEMILWNVATGREIKSFTGHEMVVGSVVFSPNGHFALSGGNDAMLKLWDVSEWTQPQEARR